MEFKKILVPVDGSETAEKAFKVGLDMAIKHNAELFLLYVADMNDAAYPVLQVTLDENGFISMRKKAEEVLSNLKAQIPVGTRLTALVKIGDPGRVITSLAEDNNIDMIIMGSRGRGAISSFIMGSVSQYVLGPVNCPVMVIR